MQAQAVIDRARLALHDDDGVRWPDPELLMYVADGQHMVANVKPTATATTVHRSLAAGSTRQQAPNDCALVLNVIRNVGGRAVVMTSKKALDAMIADWHSDQDSEVEHWVYDMTEDRDVFYVHPAPAQALEVEIVYSRRPPASVQVGDELMLSDQYINALIDWVLYRAFGKDSDYGGNLNRAQMHLQAAATSLGVRTESLRFMDPNRKRRGGETGGQV